MQNTRAALFFNGTWSSSQKTAPKTFVAKQLHQRLLYNPTNSIIEMYDHCREKHKKIFEGPGTDILDKKNPSLIGTLTGGIYGGAGINSVKNNLENAKTYLLDLYKTNNQKPLDIHLFGWSRGAYTVD